MKQPARITWDRPTDYILNVIGYVIGLGNIWRFPYLCYKNGGGAFLIPYLLLQAFFGLPLLFMETALGQYTHHSAVGSWDIVPMMKGVGFTGVILSWNYLSYVLIIMGWSLFYLVHSLRTTELPWSSCNNTWNTNSCLPAVEIGNQSFGNVSISTQNTTISTKEFFDHYLLQKTDGIEDMGTFTNWRMMLCFLASWVICYLCVLKGIKTSGKVAYVTVLTPYLMLIILLVRGATLDGAKEGVLYFITPRPDRLLDPAVWLDAGGQVLYTLGVCFVVLYTLGSYNKFNTDCYKTSIIGVATCSFTSLLTGFVLFCYLGHMAHEQGKNITEVAAAGPGLLFEVFPVGLSFLPLPQLWSCIFFTTVIFISIDTAFASIEGITGVLEDILPQWKIWPGMQLGRIGMCAVPFLIGIPMLFDGGIYVLELVNWYGCSGVCILTVALIEVTSLSWIYGIDRFFDNVKEMIGYQPNVVFKYVYRFVLPIITLAILIAFCAQYSPLKLDNYEYPGWGDAVGWILFVLAILPIPTVAMYTILKEEGSFLQRLRLATTSKHRKPDIDLEEAEKLQIS